MFLHQELKSTKHTNIVVVMPNIHPRAHTVVPFGSVGSGRTYRTPDNRKITFATPNQPIPEGPFHLILHGWGHHPTQAEREWNAKWRAASKG